MKFLDLNIENDNHIDAVLSLFKKINPDVLCVQEVYEKHAELFKEELKLNLTFTPLCLKPLKVNGDEKIVRWGQAIFTRNFPIETESRYYLGDPDNLKVFFRPDQTTRYKALTTVKLNHNGKIYTFITTHFTWTPDGEVSEEQLEHLKIVMRMLRHYTGFILTGDFNAPRGNEVYNKLASQYKDTIPKEVITTLDKKFHKAPEFDFVVDYLFSTPGYKVTGVKLHDGVSDHMAIEADIK